jgi:signal transduction histidine kinase
MDHTMDNGGTPDANPEGLAHKIAVVGLAVSQAADELQRVAERLISAEADARDSDARARMAEQQLAEGASKNAELLDLLQRAREQQSEAEERSRRAEQRLQISQERARLMEEQLRELEARVEEAESRPQVTVIVDQERDAIQRAVAAEIRRPLTSILGLTLALKHHDPKSPEGREMLRQLSTSARKLDRLVTQLVDLDRLVSGELRPNRRRTDMGAVVQRVVEETVDLANRDVRVETGDRVVVSVDPQLAEQMIDTLLTNAGRRTVPGSTVWVRAEAQPGGIIIAVDDTGPEVPGGLRQALFAAIQERPGAQPQRPRGATGLSLLSKLAEIHGGKAWVEERPGGGASFRVFLPDASEGGDADEREDRGVVALDADGDGNGRPEAEALRPASFIDYEIAEDTEDGAIAIT